MVQGITLGQSYHKNRLWPKIISTSNTDQSPICELSKSLLFVKKTSRPLDSSLDSLLFYILKNIYLCPLRMQPLISDTSLLNSDFLYLLGYGPNLAHDN